ncbi:Mss4-like protein [Podospora aff. communis PSN243]|uniref:Mss4-like protein n=1 Tax=Podospora aff. communis PSN243 TaxID=3040156 RepID=A0AAV9GDK7_9PEZI|nr:Mss4-like protein [Podospora aff. communis PSN243]
MPLHLAGHCVCGELRYCLELDSADDARTTLCHCNSCRRAFGTNYGLTAKVPIQAFKYESGSSKTHKQENGVTREFCANCGTFICEYGEEAADKFRYVMWGTLDEPEKIAPKGEFFCKNRTDWMPEIPDVFHKQEIKQ